MVHDARKMCKYQSFAFGLNLGITACSHTFWRIDSVEHKVAGAYAVKLCIALQAQSIEYHALNLQRTSLQCMYIMV